MKGANARTRAAEIAWRFRANPMSSRGVQELGDAIMVALCELEGERDEWRNRFTELCDDLFIARAQLAMAKEALKRIERWFGEFPETGYKWEDGTPMGYGSNGQRDYMRFLARAAIKRIATLDKYGAAPYPPSHAEQETVAQTSQEDASPEAPAPSAADHTGPP